MLVKGGYLDVGFALPTLGNVGPHLNFIHVMYIVCYLHWGGSYNSNGASMGRTMAFHHLTRLVLDEGNPQCASLDTVLASLLLFITLLHNRMRRMNSPHVPILTVQKVATAFELLFIYASHKC